MRYFYYISEQKVEMLSAQMKKGGFTLASISSKLGIGPASVTLMAEKRNAGLVSATLRLLKALENSCQITPSSNIGALQSSTFYLDRGKWHSGLFKFDSWCNKPTVIYALWKSIGQSLILLIGSPNNILGEKVVSAECFVPGSSGAHLEILEFVDRNLTMDEPVMVCTNAPETYGDDHVAVPQRSVSKIILPAGFEPPGARNRRTSKEDDEDDDLLEMHAEKGVSLCLLCLRSMARLPEVEIEVLFRVFSEHAVPSEEQKEKFGSWKPAKTIRKARSVGLFNYKRVFLGSPVYTAIE